MRAVGAFPQFNTRCLPPQGTRHVYLFSAVLESAVSHTSNAHALASRFIVRSYCMKSIFFGFHLPTPALSTPSIVCYCLRGMHACRGHCLKGFCCNPHHRHSIPAPPNGLKRPVHMQGRHPAPRRTGRCVPSPDIVSSSLYARLIFVPPSVPHTQSEPPSPS